jgi:hypothetical protein
MKLTHCRVRRRSVFNLTPGRDNVPNAVTVAGMGTFC